MSVGSFFHRIIYPSTLVIFRLRLGRRSSSISAAISAAIALTLAAGRARFGLLMIELEMLARKRGRRVKRVEGT